MNFEYKLISNPNDQIIDTIAKLDKEIFPDPYPRAKLAAEIQTKNDFVLFIVYDEDKPVAYKAGYQLTTRLFYSWIGGVLPSYRGKGIARKLMDLQHEKVKELGYQVVRTHTENQFRGMLIFNLKYGFDITGVYKSLHRDVQSIMLEKSL